MYSYVIRIWPTITHTFLGREVSLRFRLVVFAFGVNQEKLGGWGVQVSRMEESFSVDFPAI